jgi:hypothetical protein
MSKPFRSISFHAERNRQIFAWASRYKHLELLEVTLAVVAR